MSLLLALALQAASAGTSPPDCQALAGSVFDGPDLTTLPARIDGATLRSPNDVRRLRERSGAAPVVIHGGAFVRADFRGAPLRNLCFVGTDLSGSDWRGVDASGAAFIDANLEGANLQRARLTRVLLRQANLKDVNATGADLSGGKADGGWDGSFENLRLDNADLSGFRFDCGITISDGCALSGDISFRGADLTSAAIDTYHQGGAFPGARLQNTRVSLSQLNDLADATFEGPIVIVGGEAEAVLTPADYHRLRPHLREPGEAAAPSFDCTRAATPVERDICGPYGGEVRALDLAVNAHFRRASATSPAVSRSQREWLRTRNACVAEDGSADQYCLRESYRGRLGALLGLLGAPSELRPGSTIVYVTPRVEVAEAFQSDPLFARLVPVLVGSAYGRVVVRVNADGSLDARGDAIGGNAHLCTLGGEGLRLDRATGWYSARPQPERDTPAQWRDRPVPVLMLWDDRAAVYRNGHAPFDDANSHPQAGDYASCGARAGFSKLVRVPVPAAEAARLYDSLGEP